MHEKVRTTAVYCSARNGASFHVFLDHVHVGTTCSRGPTHACIICTINYLETEIAVALPCAQTTDLSGVMLFYDVRKYVGTVVLCMCHVSTETAPPRTPG